MSENRNGFTSKLGVVLATVGTAVGPYDILILEYGDDDFAS